MRRQHAAIPSTWNQVSNVSEAQGHDPFGTCLGCPFDMMIKRHLPIECSVPHHICEVPILYFYLCYLAFPLFSSYHSPLYVQTSLRWLVTHSHSLLLQQVVRPPLRARPTHNVVDKAGPVLPHVCLATTVRSRTTGTLNVFLVLVPELPLLKLPWSLWHEPRLLLPNHLRPQHPPRQPLLLPARPLS
jgi:hypothetical protein